MRYRNSIALLFLCAALSMTPLLAQKKTLQPNPAAPAAAAMTNDDVIALVGAGLDDSIVIAKIQSASSTSFDTSIAGLKALKAASVSTAVIKVMLNPAAASAPAVATTAAPIAGDPNDPLSSHAPGIYAYYKGLDGQSHMTKLAHVVPKQAKSSGAYLSGLTYGITKAKVRVVIDGAQASLELDDADPTFYAYIPEDNSSFGGSSLSIKDFSLVKFDVDKKNAKRQVVTGTASIWGASTGTDAKALQGFDNQQVKTGIFKLTLPQALPPGEYAFQQAGATGSSEDTKNTGSYFDFGILGQK